MNHKIDIKNIKLEQEQQKQKHYFQKVMLDNQIKAK